MPAHPDIMSSKPMETKAARCDFKARLRMRNAYFANLLISLMVLEVKQKARRTKMTDNRVESSAPGRPAGSPIFFLAVLVHDALGR
jgi:hypothetical protein